METLGVYISVPFCRSKCSYCNFASGVFPDASHHRYVERMIADIAGVRAQAALLGARVPDVANSLYFGGGTPSILPPALFGRLLVALRTHFDFAEMAEITIECAPGQIEDGFLAAMVEYGVNRVSFGVQSFIDGEAAATGRLHTRAVALRDIERVRKAGIRSVSADLIAGLPHQTAESWRESLSILVESGVDHASVYMLEVDNDSRLGRELLDGGGRYHAGAVPSDDLTADLYLEAVQTLNRNGLQQYEISNFARPGAQSLHNRKYWLRKPYIGFGLDAHSMLHGPGPLAVRFRIGDDLPAYLDGAGLAGSEPVSRQQALEEAWFLGLRLNEGVALLQLKREFGHAEVHSYNDIIAGLAEDRLVIVCSGRVRLSERGRLLSNEVFERFLREDPVKQDAFVLVD